ncbi:MAG: hypothetical protein GY768_16240 [Planctomycetaceae bacterium]|nr:hypothetical protein [Planctomycetaceae bacterium]
MERILTNSALRELNQQGYVRTGLRLPDSLMAKIREHFSGVSPQSSNWSFFYTRSLEHYATSWWRAMYLRFKKTFGAKALHRTIQGDRYDKTIFGSTHLLPLVIKECMANGLSNFLGEVPLLVGHDIYLENSRDKTTFGFHEDGFGWDIFYQSGDDLSFYIPLVDLTEETGGRLCVEQNADKTIRYRDWNRRIVEFSEFCQSVGAVDERGLVTREAIMKSKRRKMIAQRFLAIYYGRSLLPTPKQEELQPVDFKAGEVVLFNNKRYHDIEPWCDDNLRSVYIIRCVPLYDFGMAPPTEFLNKVPCNRYLLEDHGRSLVPFLAENELPDCYPVPVD